MSDYFQDAVQRRVRAALRLLFVGDALAMPVHWYYRLSDIWQAFPGGVKSFESAPAHHPSSLMSFHSTRTGGRANLQQGKKPMPEVVGEVILKGRAHHWNQRNRHYHHGMQAGENTLNAHCARVLMRRLAADGGEYHSEHYLADYIAFMTADPPSHPDTYAESFHRAFFANWSDGKPAEQCGTQTHDTASIGGLVMIAPLAIILLACGYSVTAARQACRQHLSLSHPDAGLASVCDDLVSLIAELLQRDAQATPQPIIARLAADSVGLDLPLMMAKVKRDEDFVGKLYSHACYIDGAWPGVLYLLYKYPHNSVKALLKNTNLGGDNVHRGAVLGCLLGLADAEPADRLFEQLVDAPALEREIDALILLMRDLRHPRASDPETSRTDHHWLPSTDR